MYISSLFLFVVATAEKEIASIDENMIASGCDAGKLVELTKRKALLEGQILKYMEEWEELEALLSQSQ